MSHDQLFKELLQEFFREFLELFFSRVAARLDFSRVTFLDKELFTDSPEGDLREADLIAQVYTLDGQPEVVLIHVEVERQRRNTFSARMHDYYHIIRWRKKLAVYPIAIYLSPGAGGLVRETYTESVFDEEIDRFTYWAVGLPDLSADDYRDSENVLASGLSALMRVSTLGKAVQKAWQLRRVAQSAENEARKFLLVNLIEKYLPLQGAEAEEFERLTAQPEAQEVHEMISIYEERGIEKGIERGIAIGEERAKEMLSVYEERGIEKGIAKGVAIGEERAKEMLSVYEERGIEKGIAKGVAIGEERAKEMLSVYEERGIEKGIEKGVAIGERNRLLKVLRRKFGELPESLTAQIEMLASQDIFDEMFDRAMDAQTLDDLGLNKTQE